MALYYTAADIELREATLGCCFATLADKVAKKIGYGIVCDLDIAKLNLLNVYIEIISCYTPITSPAEDGVLNCITEAELDGILAEITRCYTECDLCFPPKGNATGYSAEGPPVTTLYALESVTPGAPGYYLLEDGSYLIMEYYN